MSYTGCTHIIYAVCTAVLAFCAIGCLVRIIAGPSVADRLVGINMTGTLVICLIALLGARSGEGGFADIAIVYALLSFLAVVVLTGILGKGK